MIFPKKLKGRKAYITLQAQREIGTQILFALAAFKNITKKGKRNDIRTHSSIHSFLTHSANISKLLWSPPAKRGETNVQMEIGDDLAIVLGVPKLPLLKNRDLRNDLDHYDVRLVSWINDVFPKRKPISDLTVGKKINGAIIFRHYDPVTTTYTFKNHEVSLTDLRNELVALQSFIGGPKLKGQ